MPVPVPQFIKEETKIMGILTFTQLGIITAGGGLLTLLYFTIDLRLWVFFAGIGIPAILIIAFGQVEGIAVFRLLPYILRHIWIPKNYLWYKEKIASVTLPSKKTQQEKKLNEPVKIKKELDLKTLEQISKYLDQ